ncbi:MAG TPA: RDD family protein [Saprospiraceae bacterium]|nr:RDD family protein [Saprospiraceae bacterium]
MPGQITIETTQNVNLQYEIAPLGERIVANIIDGLIRIAVFIVALIFLNVLSPGFEFGAVAIVTIILFAVPFVFYHLLFEIFNNGQSPGKRIFDLRVVSIRGEMVSIGAYLLRWLFRIVDFHIFSGLVALIAVASSDKGQRVGDMVAGTTVIKESRRVVFRQLAFDEVRAEYVPTYPQATKLQPVHIELIKETLNDLALENSEGHVKLLADKTAGMLGLTYEEHPRKFLRTIVNDYSGVAR